MSETFFEHQHPDPHPRELFDSRRRSCNGCAMRDAEIARLKAELDKERKRYDALADCKPTHGTQIRCDELEHRVHILRTELDSANADADLLGREVAAWRAEYQKWSDGDHHFHEPVEAIADTDARPTAAARVKGGA